jgi:hypothetical protein
MSSLDHQRSNPVSKDHVEISETRARQGVTGHNVRYVLGASLLAVIAAFALIYYFFFFAH